MDILYHINHAEDWSLLISNLNKLRASIKAPYKIAIMLSGDTVTKLMDLEALSDIERLSIDKGTEFMVFHLCMHSAESHHIETESLPDVVVKIPLAALTLLTYQKAGFAYIKV